MTDPSTSTAAADQPRVIATVVTRIAGWILLVQGAVIVLSWHSGVGRLLAASLGAHQQVRYNTALCLGIYGAGLIATVARRFTLAMSFAVGGLLVSALT